MLGDFIILGIILILIILSIRFYIKERKKGGCGNCSCCPAKCGKKEDS